MCADDYGSGDSSERIESASSHFTILYSIFEMVQFINFYWIYGHCNDVYNVHKSYGIDPGLSIQITQTE